MEQSGPTQASAQDLSQDAASVSPSAVIGTSLDAEQTGALASEATPEIVVVPPHHNAWLPWVFVALLACLVIGGGIFITKGRQGSRSQLQSGHFGTIALPLKQLQATNTSSNAAQSLQVNGQLQVSGPVLLTPSSQPSNPQSGQIYFDKITKQVNYYDGSKFQAVGDGNVTNITNVTNVLSGQGAGVRLQAASPGTPQIGNFNISGTGVVGKVQTTTITSDGGTLYVNPVGATAQQTVAVGTPSKAGLSDIGSQAFPGPGWANDLTSTKVTMGSVGGTAVSISVYNSGGTVGKHVQLALYDDDGDVPSKPGALLAASAVGNLVPNGWTTLSISGVNLTANASYWLAVNTDDNTVGRAGNGGNKSTCFVTGAFGFMPDPFSAFGCFYDPTTYSIYLNYLAGAGVSGSLSQAQMVIGPTGQTLFQNTIDSTTAFKVQNAAGTNTVLNIDTLNGRIGIGKTTPTFKLDIAAGDINLSNGRSVRFGGLQALSTNGAGTTTSITNFIPGGKVSAQADIFVVQDADASHQNLTIGSNGAATFSNKADSATAFRIQNATGTTTLFTVDSAGLNIYIGNPAGSATPVILVLANKNTAGDPAGGTEGGTYYNSTLKTFRCFRNRFWQNCADVEPQHTFSVYDEFMGGSNSITRNIGSLGWNAINIGATGSIIQNPSTPTPIADRPGVLQLQTPAVANQGNTILLAGPSGGSMLMSADNDMKTSVAVGATTNQVLRVGLHNQMSGTTQPTTGIWWEADTSMSLNWQYCYGTGSGATCAPTAVAIAANTWVSLEIRLTATGPGTSAATFVINDTPFTVSATTIDTAGRVSPALSFYTTAGSVQSCYWDYFQLTGTTSATR